MSKTFFINFRIISVAKKQQEREEEEEAILGEMIQGELKKPKFSAILVESIAIILENVF